jgi:aldose 1-epimerase
MAADRYGVRQEDFEGHVVYALLDGQAGQVARVLPSVGNNCVSYRVRVNQREVELLLAAPDPETLQGRPSGYGIPLLFPWPNRIENGRFAFEGAEVNLETPEPGAHPLHGFVLSRPWQVIDSGNDDGAWVTSRISSSDFDDIGRQWPYPFEATCTYQLREGRLAVEFLGRNVGNSNMPCGLGFHPYFGLPLQEGGDRGTCMAQLPTSQYWPLREDNIPVGDVVPVEGRYDLREPTALDDRYYDDVWTDVTFSADGWSRSRFVDPQAGVQIDVEADGGFREWVFFAPDSRPVVCFEPYTCTTDAFNLATRGVDGGMTVLQPGATLSGEMRFVPTPV